MCCVLPFNYEKVYLTNAPYLGIPADPNVTRQKYLDYVPFEKLQEIYNEKNELSKSLN
jgi:hypothetical protein